MTDLRAELGAPEHPDFDLALPPGWTRREPDDATLDVLLTGLRDRLMREHQPQVYAQVRPQLTQAFEAMRREGAFAFFMATEPQDDTLWIPASIVATVRRAEPGETLDPFVRGLIQQEGATPLLEDKRTLRFERERTVRIQTETIVNHSVFYLTPVPGTGRRRALQLVAGFGRTVETPPEHPSVVAMKVLFDACVSTLRWRPAAGLPAEPTTAGGPDRA
jgi:hypothetical protein